VGRHDLTLAFAALAFVCSIGLGALHALAPGHGKTVMAAYLVGQRGSLRQALIIGLTVTATHTLGVLALGIAISASAIIAPERLYPWLGLVSGLLLAAIGGGLLVRIRGIRAGRASVSVTGSGQGGDHDTHEHVHSHGDRVHSHGPLGADQPVTWRGLLAMGFVGGFLPSPSAVVVVLGAIALGRTWFGVILVVAYGLGMAATLTGGGVLLLRARDILDRRVETFGRSRLLLASSRMLPTATAIVIMVVGLYLAARGAAAI
jgi:ABC-type nickel/cobalt efflux system permease component RcnA